MTPKQEAALRQALEALEEIAFAGMSPSPEMIDAQEAFHARQAWRFISIAANALESLREALVEPNPYYPCRSDGRCQYAIDHGAEGVGHCPKGLCVMVQHTQPDEDKAVCERNLRVAREMFNCQTDPVQEPVAYIHRQGKYWEVSERFLTDDEKARGWTEEPLYTNPPQRKPLSDEEIWELAANCLNSVAGRLQFARAIEAAHGITGENT